MDPIRSFQQLAGHLSGSGVRRRIAVVCGSDSSTCQAADRALAGGFAEIVFVGRTADVRRRRAAEPFPALVRYVDAADDASAARQAAGNVIVNKCFALNCKRKPRIRLNHAHNSVLLKRCCVLF